MAPLRVNDSAHLILLLTRSKFKEQNPRPVLAIRRPAVGVSPGLFLSDFIWCEAGQGRNWGWGWGWNPGPYSCKASALPLSHVPRQIFAFKNVWGWAEDWVCVCVAQWVVLAVCT